VLEILGAAAISKIVLLDVSSLGEEFSELPMSRDGGIGFVS
jgi:hypothetical protein